MSKIWCIEYTRSDINNSLEHLVMNGEATLLVNNSNFTFLKGYPVGRDFDQDSK